MIPNPQAGLTFGSLNLMGTDADRAANKFVFWTQGDDMDWGNPVPIEEKVISWLRDGALVDLKGYDNREIFIRVQVEADDHNYLALAEAALMLESGKPNLLTWTPPDGVGAPCVFSVVMSHLEPVTDDEADLRIDAEYGLRIQAEPFVRSQDLVSVTVPAPTGTQTFTTVDDCNSFSGWAGALSGAPTATVTTGTSGGSVFVNAVGIPEGKTVTASLTRTALGTTAPLAGTPYLRVRLSVTSTEMTMDIPTFTVTGSGGPVAVVPSVQEGAVYWLDTTGLGLGTYLTGISVKVKTKKISQFQDSTVRLSIADVFRSNFLGTQGTNRQLSRTIPIAGSARTQGNLVLSDATNALGTTLIYTCPATPDLLQPNLRALLATGNAPTSEILSVSGFNSDLTTLHGFDVPESSLSDSTGYQLLARVRHASTGAKTVAWAAKSRMGSTNLSDFQTGAVSITIPVAATYAVYPIATLNLPPRKMGPGGVVRLELSCPGLILDEAWLFNIDDGELTWVECGTGTSAVGGPSKNLFLDAANIQTPVPTAWLGHSLDRSDQFHTASEMVSFGEHDFEPGLMNIWTMTTNSQAASVTLSHFPRYLTRVVAA